MVKQKIKLIGYIILIIISNINIVQATDVNLKGQVYTANVHPRILITPAILANIQAKANSANPVWEGLIADANYRYGLDGNNAESAAAFNYALIYLINDTLADNTGENFGEMAVNAMMAFTDSVKYDVSTPWSSNPNRDYGSIDLMYLACTWDWIYPLLTNEQKTTFLTWIKDSMLPMIYSHQQIVDSPPNGYPESNLWVKFNYSDLKCLIISLNNSFSRSLKFKFL